MHMSGTVVVGSQVPSYIKPYVKYGGRFEFDKTVTAGWVSRHSPVSLREIFDFFRTFLRYRV